jgi:asparagine N-glycosylation enzyme membrane subunit Stt3
MENLVRSDNHEFERQKMAVDVIKHIMTLGTGTIAWMATFFDKLPKPLVAKEYWTAGIVLMLLCLIFSFAYLWRATLDERKYQPARMKLILSLVIYFSFPLAIGSLAVFAYLNLSK